MAKSETVQSIIHSIREHREKFERFCHSLSEEELGQPVPGSTWVVKDFVSHLATLDTEMARSFEAAAAGRPEEASGEERERLWRAVVEVHSRYEDNQKSTERRIPVVILRPEGES